MISNVTVLQNYHFGKGLLVLSGDGSVFLIKGIPNFQSQRFLKVKSSGPLVGYTAGAYHCLMT